MPLFFPSINFLRCYSSLHIVLWMSCILCSLWFGILLPPLVSCISKFLWSPHRCMSNCAGHNLPLQFFPWTMLLEFFPVSSRCTHRLWIIKPILFLKNYHRKWCKHCVKLGMCSPIQVRTLFICISIIFKRIRHSPFNMPNTRSTHMRMELCTKFQWYSSRESLPL